MNRLDASLALKRQIRKRFRHECAVCATGSELTADVAHLYEDATRQKATADRLIVLCANCNQAEARAKGRSKPALTDLFDPEEVSARARRSYREGNYSSAYAGQRLAAYLFEMGHEYSRAVACLIEAISALRPIRWGDFLTSTLLEVERLCLCRRIAAIQRWLCLDRFSLVLYDYRRWDDSARVQYASQLVRAEITDDQRYPEELKFDRSSSFRREALINASTVTVGRSGLRKLIGRLLEDAQEFRLQGQFDGYATNLDVCGKLALERGNNAMEAHEYSQQALECAAKITHQWALQEHHWREADYYLLKKDRPRKVASVVEALRVFRDHPVVLEPTLGASGPVSHDPIAELARYGISEDELRERGVAPSTNPPRELALRLPQQRLERIVKNIMRSAGV